MTEMKGKYVIVLGEAILFPLTMLHSDFKGYNPTSAGFFEIWTSNESFSGEYAGTIYVDTYGESTTLRLQSKKSDADLIKIKFQHCR